MKTNYTALLAAVIIAALLSTVMNSPAADAKLEPASLKYGLYIHYGMPTFANQGEQGQIPVERFSPTALDVKQWTRTAKEAGMNFSILTAKHDSGFCLWDSANYDYDVGNSPFKADIIADFIAACKAEGIAPGIHYSIPDAYNEGEVRHKGPVPPPYFNVIKKHVTELHTKYPQIRIQIFDDDGTRLTPAQYKELCEIIQQLNPQCLILNHVYEPRHTSATVIKSWMWWAGAQFNTPQFLFDRYNQSRVASRPFLLNVGPDRTGSIPAKQIAVLMGVKKLIDNPTTTQPTAPAAAPVTQPDAGERLKKLKSLFDQGLINKEDYDKKVKEIMNSL